jgi:hypothetical protein
LDVCRLPVRAAAQRHQRMVLPATTPRHNRRRWVWRRTWRRWRRIVTLSARLSTTLFDFRVSAMVPGFQISARSSCSHNCFGVGCNEAPCAGGCFAQHASVQPKVHAPQERGGR